LHHITGSHVVRTLAGLTLLAGSLATALPVSGQVHDVQHYTNREGLPQLQVLAVHQDGTGYMWFGTYGGLSRFDGADVRTFAADEGLSSNVVTRITEDRVGRLWAGTRGGGVCALEGETLRCMGAQDGLAGDDVTALYADTDGSLWVGSQNGLGRIAADDVTAFNATDGLPANAVGAVARDAQGRLWVGTSGGLAQLEGDGFVPVTDPALAGHAVQALLSLGEGLLIGTDRGLLLLADNAVTPLALPDAAAGASVASAALGASDVAWIATDRGLLRYQDGSFQLLTMANGLMVNSSTDVTVDREDNVWLATDRGATVLVPGPFQVFTPSDGLPNAFVRALAEDDRGRLWVGTRDGVGIATPGGFRVIIPGEDLPDPRVYALHPAPGGGVLVGTRGGLVHWREGAPLRSYHLTDGLPSDFVLALLPDGEGGIWVGTQGGLARWRDGVVVPLPADHPLATAFVVSLRRDPQGRLWAGLATGGVRIWNGDTLRTLGEAEGLTEQTVWAMDVDDAGRMWLGSNGDGVFVVEGERVQRFTTEDGLVNDFVWQVFPDASGAVWLYTNRGLQRYRAGRFEGTGTGTRLVPLEGSAGASFEDAGGRLWFGTSNGLLEFQPDLDHVNVPPPPVVIEEFTLGGEALSPGQEIRPGSSPVRARFAALSYRNPASVRHQYRLTRGTGAPAAWSEPTDERAVTFAGLGPGRYHFEVRGINGDGIVSLAPASFSFVVLPALWQSWWFRLAGVVLLSGGVASIPAVRARRLAAERTRLEARVAERTGELHQANDRLKGEITERERAEDALRVSETHLRDIVENSTNVFYAHTPQHELTYLSPQIEPLLGFTPEECLMRWTELATDHPENEAAFQSTMRAIETGERQPAYDLQLRHCDGRGIWVRVTEAPVVRDGATVGMIGSLTDITETRLAEAESQRLQEQLVQAQKMEAVGRLAAGVAHDFNNLLTSILGHAELVASELGAGHAATPDLDELRVASERAAGLVEQLLAFGRQQFVKPEVMDVNEVIRGDTEMLRQVLGDNVTLTTELSEGPLPVRMDRGQLGRILLNLALNARHAMPRGGRLTITTATEHVDHPPEGQDDEFIPGRHVILRVADTGHGMDERTLGRIFEPFFTTKDVGDGTGLGLSTVYGIIKQNGGLIRVASQPGRGTTFKICVPLHDTGAEASADATAAAEA
jgi:PAS domain S-box-containing protein